VHGFRCYDNIAPNAKCQRVLVLALCLVATIVWNSLSKRFCTDDISRGQFVEELKTFLFARAFSSVAPLRTFV